ncbi:unnamed protein product [Hapterophycus canaliculatus]
MMAFAAKSVLRERRFEASEATKPWTTAFDGNGNTFWYNERTNETSHSPPGEEGRDCCFSPQLPTAGVTSMATPFNGRMTPTDDFMSPSVGCMMPANRYITSSVHGCTVPFSTNSCLNGCISPPVMTSPASGYESHPGNACMSPLSNCHYRQQQEHQHDHYPVQTRSPCCAGHTPGTLPQPYGGFHHQQEGRRNASLTSSAAATTIAISGGYRWEECYRQDDGKKFWRHKETGAILKKDPYR